MNAVATAFAQAFARQEVLGVSRWCDAHAVFVRDGHGPTPWETARTPYLREVLDSAANPSLRQITLKKCEQMGGTECVQRILQEVVDQRPRPVLYIYPNEKVAAKQARLKLLPSLRASPRTLARLGSARTKANSMLLRLDRMAIMLAGSNSPANVEGFAAGLTIVDELDRCDEATLPRVRGRGSAFHDPLLLVVSTPGLAGAGIDAEFMAGDRRRYHVPCPHCWTYHVRALEHLCWPGTTRDGRQSLHSRDFSAGAESVERHAAMRCPTCRNVIEHSHNLWQLSRGVWVPEGCTLDPLLMGLNGSEVVPTPRGTPRRSAHRSYELTGLYRCLPDGVNPYGVIAAEYVSSNANPDPEWWNRRMGMAWSPKGEGADYAHVMGAGRKVSDGGWTLGTAPPWAVALIAGVDVQANSAYVEVLAVSGNDEPGGQKCGLVWCGEVPSPTGLGLAAAEAAATRVFPVHGSERTLRAKAVAMDSGHRPDEVYRWAAQGGLRRAVKGVGGGSGRGSMAGLVRWSSVDVEGKSIPLLLINTWAFKGQAVAQLQNSANPHDLGGSMRLELPENVPASWASHLTSEHLVRVRRGGVLRQAWVLRQGRTANHYLDCHVYALAAAYALGASGLRRLPAPKAPRIAPGAMIRKP